MLTCPPLRLALAVPLLFAPSSELPLESWIERSANMDSVVLDFEVKSADGEMGLLHFAYEAPDRCHMSFEGKTRVEQWIDGGVMTVHAAGEQGAMHYTIDLAELFEPSELWLANFEEQLPRVKPATPRHPGPLFLIWPDSQTDSVLFKFEYTTNSPLLFAWLGHLAGKGDEVRELEDGAYELGNGEDLRIELEAQLGVPRAAWMGSGEEARQAIRLLQLELDGDVSLEFEIPDVPDPDADRSEEMAAQITRATWGSSRVSAHSWIWNRTDQDGIELSDGDLEELTVCFESYYQEISGAVFMRRLELECQRIDTIIGRIQELANDPAEQGKVPGMIVELRRGAEEQFRKGLGQLQAAFLEQIESVPVEGAGEAHVAGMLELERQGAARFVETSFVEPVIAHLKRRMDELD